MREKKWRGLRRTASLLFPFGSRSISFQASGFPILPFPLSFPFRLALARAETLRPAPAAVLLRALRRTLRVSAPPNIANRSQYQLAAILLVPPKKHALRLGSSRHSRFGCP